MVDVFSVILVGKSENWKLFVYFENLSDITQIKQHAQWKKNKLK